VHCLASFDTTSMAVLFERICRKEGIAAKIVPVPRSLSASCGLACEFPCDSEARVRELCAKKSVDVASYHSLNSDWT
jgi:ribosomal protein L7Ae-like RNA K-turn-binding protein